MKIQNKINNIRDNLKSLALALPLAVVFFGTGQVVEANTTYIGPADGAWSDPANWQGGVVPTSDSPVIDTAGPLIGSSDMLSISAGFYIGALGGPGSVTQTGGSLTVNNMEPGYGAEGTYTLSGGTLNLMQGGWDLLIGRAGNGTFNLQGGTFSSAGQIWLGFSGGTGTFNMTGGTLISSYAGVAFQFTKGQVNFGGGDMYLTGDQTAIGNNAWFHLTGAGNFTASFDGTTTHLFYTINTWNNASHNYLWDTASGNWVSPITWNQGDSALFDATGADPSGLGTTVTLAESITAHGITVNATNYTFAATSGNTLTLAGASEPIVSVGCSNVTIGVSLNGTQGLTVAGTSPANSLTLAGDVSAGTYNNLSGPVDVKSGTLVLAQKIGGANGGTVSSGFTIPGINSLDTGATVKLYNVWSGANTNNNRAGNGQIDPYGILNLTGGTFDVNGEDGNQQVPAPRGTGLIINGSQIADGGLKIFCTGTEPITFYGTIADGGPVTNSLISGKLAHRMNVDLNYVPSGAVFELAGINTYSRDTRIGAGLLRMVGAGTIGSVTTNTPAIGLRINGNQNNGDLRFDLKGTSPRASGLGGTGGIIANNAVGTTSVLTLGVVDGSTDTGTPSWPSSAANGIIVDNTTGTGGIMALTKVGTNTQVLAMTAANTYSGPTTINNGIRAFSAVVGVSVNSAIHINSPGKLGLNYTGNQTVPGLYINGVQMPNGVYSSANEVAAILGAGTITVTGSTAQPVLAASASSGNLTFSWPGGVGFYKLQSQTNTLTGTWYDYAGGGINPVSVPINNSNASVFFRLAPAP